MAGSVNKVILVGNLGRDPEVRYSQDGNKIVNMSLATSESWTDRSSGERREKTEWHRVVIFNDRLGEIAEKYLNKGSKVYLEGQLQTRKWTGNDGQETRDKKQGKRNQDPKRGTRNEGRETRDEKQRKRN